MKRDYDLGRARIYELVVNTRPAHAYLLDGNSLVAQLLVIAHVLGHAIVFDQSRSFEPADKGFLPRVRAGAARIEEYMTRHGRTEVEDFLDHCEALATTVPQAQLAPPHVPDEPELTTLPYDELFPDEVAERRRRHEAERAALRERFPRHPERDVLGFVMRHARALDDWQRDVIGIVREEQRYFSPQIGTRILHEGMATWCHNTILQRLQLESADFVEYQRLNAGVVQPHHFELNPYGLGWAIFREIARIAERPDDEDRERWQWAGRTGAVERILEVVEGYDDVALVSEFLTPRVCAEARLYAWQHDTRDPSRLVISSREADEVRAAVLRATVNGGLPVVEIVDADGSGRGELVLEHRVEGIGVEGIGEAGIGLDAEYARGTLLHLAQLWGKPVSVTSVMPDGRPVRYRAEPRGDVAEELLGGVGVGDRSHAPR